MGWALAFLSAWLLLLATTICTMAASERIEPAARITVAALVVLSVVAGLGALVVSS